MKANSDKAVEHLFRKEYGKLISILVNIFGPSHIELAEDIVQETLISALNNWSTQGVPDNPTGWLVLVSKRKIFNELKRNDRIRSHEKIEIFDQIADLDTDSVFLETEIEDSQLRMIFTCCHPALTTESQIALTLKTLCGFGVKEVANALLTTESTINKRLYRAKLAIRESNSTFSIPQGKALDERLEAVMLTLYLLFNEGYNSSSNHFNIRKDLCLEAIRLVRILITRFKKHKEVNALLALMCFHAARFEARIDDNGTIILFEDQNRNLWHKELINIGMNHLREAMTDKKLTAYHLEASIAAEHCMSESFQSTDWITIQNMYTLLNKIKPNPVIDLNIAIIESQIKGIPAALTMLQNLEKDKVLNKYYLLPLTQAIFNMRIGEYQKAIIQLIKAKKMQKSDVRFIDEKIVECQKKLPNK